VLADAVRPSSAGRVRELVLVLGAAALMGVLAQLAIPFVPVPITGQTLGVLLLGALLGSRRGALALVAYLAEGLAGLPVYANGASAWTPSSAGVPTILGPTAGYLLSFPVAAYVVGALAERGWDRRVWTAGAAMAVGQAVIYAGGLSWLAQLVGPGRAVELGLLPFVAGDTVKLLAATLALPAGWRLLRTIDRP
jgi:biotin transport system substrate-specific component